MENELQVVEGVKELQLSGEMDVSKYIQTIGQVELTEDQRGILYAPVVGDEVEIRPDGLVYLPWVHYVHRLYKAFGMDWALVPKGMPTVENNIMYWPHYLIVKGSLMAFAVGQQEYFEDNERMTWGDASEGAISNALMRVCKRIGISQELWDPAFIRRWKKEYAIFEWYDNSKKNKKEKIWWRKDGDKPWYLSKKNGIKENEKDHWAGKIHEVITDKDYPEVLRDETLEWLRKGPTITQLKDGYDRALKVLDKQQKAKVALEEPDALDKAIGDAGMQVPEAKA